MSGRIADIDGIGDAAQREWRDAAGPDSLLLSPFSLTSQGSGCKPYSSWMR